MDRPGPGENTCRPPDFGPSVASGWLADVAKVLLVTAGLVGAFVVGFHPAGLLSLLPPTVAETLCGGAFLCLPTLSILGMVSLGTAVAILRWLSDRGYVTLPDAW